MIQFRSGLLFILLIFCFIVSNAQNRILSGKITDQETNSPINSASIIVFTKGKLSGTISNADGEFRILLTDQADSIKFSSIGYRSYSINLHKRSSDDLREIKLVKETRVLSEVVVKPLTAVEIIRNAIAASSQMIPPDNYENNYFYREVISDRQNYFSVAEAVFKGQFISAKKEYKLKLIRGRTKEDVSYTRLFEDFHPGGGPQSLFENKLVTGFPEFLRPKGIDQFIYKKDSMIRHDDKIIYIIGFDQKPEVHESLDKGRIWIDAEDFSIIKYETVTSPIGIKYIKHLTGTDKIMAGLLNIEVKRKGWERKVEFIRENNKLYLLYASGIHKMEYRQPKKKLDLDLTINTEMVRTTQASPVQQLITNDEEWKRKNIVANLPSDFDEDFWGDASVISPTQEINKLIEDIGKKNNEHPAGKIDSLWQYYQRELFVARQRIDTIILIPVMKSSWEDDQTAGMLFQSIDGNFSIETELELIKNSDENERPDNGFQQAGIIVRDSKGSKENNLILCIGTPGNKNIKYFFRKTENGSSKGPAEVIQSAHLSLRIEKTGNVFSAYIKQSSSSEWKKIASDDLNWTGPLHVGFMVMARFPGNGPKMKPDMKAIFSNYKIERKR